MAESSGENMLVKLENLDELLRLAGDVIITSSNLGLTYKNVQGLYEKQEPVNKQMMDALQDLATTSGTISSELHHLVQAIRTVNLKDLSFRTRRLVRDISRKTGKRVNFIFEGEETTVDKTIVEKIYDPIAHQLRNAIDHGLEDRNERKKKGKPEEGKLELRIYNTENETFVEIEDDGRGVDMNALKVKAVAAGKVNENDEFTEEAALDFMCSAGVSTAKSVSQVSGRGVGMDVVRDNVTALGGSISFKTEKGSGSTFTFRVPLVSAVNIVDALVIRSGKYLFGFPISHVITTLSVRQDQITSTMKKGEVIKYLDSLLPLYSLNKVLEGRDIEHDPGNIPVLVIDHKGTRAAYKISEFLSPQKLVIIPFDGALSVEGVSGTTILGGRKLGFIVDVTGLVARSTGKNRYVSFTGEKKEKKKSASLADLEKAAQKEVDTARKQKEAASTAQAAPQPVPEEDEGDRAEDVPDDTVQEFLIEIEKLLPELNEALFALETDPDNEEQINLAFRIMHTMKGNLIMMGFPKAGETVHAVESVLDYVRSKKLEMSEDVMDILMDGASYVEEIARQGKAGGWQDEAATDILESAAKLMPTAQEEEKKVVDVASSEVKLSHEAYYRANNYRKKNIPFYQSYIEFDPGKQPHFLVACLIYKRVSEMADVLGTVPPLVDIENGLVEGKIKLMLASSMEPEKMENALVSLLTRHYGARTVKLNRFG